MSDKGQSKWYVEAAYLMGNNWFSLSYFTRITVNRVGLVGFTGQGSIAESSSLSPGRQWADRLACGVGMMTDSDLRATDFEKLAK